VIGPQLHQCGRAGKNQDGLPRRNGAAVSSSAVRQQRGVQYSRIADGYSQQKAAAPRRSGK
jgi:hypothetical protein